MASSRSEIRVGAGVTAAGGLFQSIGGQVPDGKRWNINLVATNATAGALTFSASIVNRRHDFTQSLEVLADITADVVTLTSVAIHPGGAAAVAIVNDFMYFVRITDGVAGVTTKIATGLNVLSAVAFSPDGNWLAVSGSVSPFLKVYAYSEVYGIGLAVSNPGTLPTAAVSGIDWHPAGSYIACSYSASNAISAWPWASGFGTKLTDSSAAAGLPGARTLAFRPQGDAIVCGHATTPFMSAWPFTTVFGTITTPTAPSSQVKALAWSPNGDAIGFLTNTIEAGKVILWASSAFSGTAFSVTTLSPGTGSQGVVPLDDYVFWFGGDTNHQVGGWNPLGAIGATYSMTGLSTTNVQDKSLCRTTLLDGGLVVYAATGAAGVIVFKHVVAPHTTSGGVGYICNALSIAAATSLKLSGFVLNEGERLLVAGSGVLSVMVSAVEVTL
mgnify:CR=1 FL=1